MTYPEMLKRVDPFSTLKDHELSAIGSFCSLKKFKYGERLFKDGDSAAHLWVVVKGMIDLRFDLPDSRTSEESTLSSVAENKILGWSSLVHPHRYKLSAYCASDKCSVLTIERDLLFGFMKDNPDAGYRILSGVIKVVGNRFERLRETADYAPFSSVKVIVHMGTCGIAAGAGEIMKVLVEEIAKRGLSRIMVSAGGCLGRCAYEPNVTVKIQNEKSVVYQKMDTDKMIRVFNEHLISGKVQNDLLLY